uniref:Uncharacterized protein n=1 Tax=Bracon brevicornis TaxID=1563983 RepID=A0A6V7HYR4_9HYME
MSVLDSPLRQCHLLRVYKCGCTSVLPQYSVLPATHKLLEATLAEKREQKTFSIIHGTLNMDISSMYPKAPASRDGEIERYPTRPYPERHEEPGQQRGQHRPASKDRADEPPVQRRRTNEVGGEP